MERPYSIAFSSYAAMQRVQPIARTEKPCDRKPEPDWNNKQSLYSSKGRPQPDGYHIDILV